MHLPTKHSLQPSKSTQLTTIKHLANLVNQFWIQWSNEYLAELCEIHKYHQKRNKLPDILLNDIVIIKDKNLPQAKLPDILLNDIVIIKDKNLPQASWKFAKIEIIVKSKEVIDYIFFIIQFYIFEAVYYLVVKKSVSQINSLSFLSFYNA